MTIVNFIFRVQRPNKHNFLGRLNSEYDSPEPVIVPRRPEPLIVPRTPSGDNFTNHDHVPELTDLESEISIPSTMPTSIQSYRSHQSNATSKFQGMGIFNFCCKCTKVSSSS